jgi:uncharacterized protein YgiM (DUF1202 family)
MSKRKMIVFISSILLVILLMACNLPASVATTALPSTAPTAAIESSATETTTEIPATPTASSTPSAATNTVSLPTLTATPQNPLVTTTEYCYSGPQSKTLKYEIISSIQAGTRVQLLGKGIVDGWWVIKNPRYGDPCWIQMQYVQIDPSYDLTGLKVIAVPATPTATP